MPFADWNGVGEFIVPLQHLQRDRNFITIGPGLDSVLDLHIPTYVRWHGAEYRAGSGRLEVHIDARHGADRLGLVVRRYAVDREPYRIRAGDFTRNPECGHLYASIAVEVDAGPISCDLLFDGELLENRVVGIPSSLVRLYSALDGDLLTHLYDEAKAGKGNSSRKFEQWIHSLLSLAGVPTVHFGHGQEVFPDLLGWVSPYDAIAVECTLTAPDLNKLARFQRRALKMQQFQAKAVPQGTVLAALFFNQSYAEVPRDVQDSAQNDGIALVAQERCLALQEAILNGTVQNRGVLDLLRSWAR
jgi:hypothetical protein